MADIPWNKIREAFMLGEESTSIAARMKAEGITVKPGTIRQRARREEWMTPRNMDKKLESRLTEIQEAKDAGVIDDKEAAKRKAQIEEFEATFDDRVKQHRSDIDKIVSAKLKTQKLPPIKTYRDLEIVDRIARRNLDMDKENNEAVVNINVLGAGGIVDDNASSVAPAPTEPPTFDMDDVEERGRDVDRAGDD